MHNPDDPPRSADQIRRDYRARLAATRLTPDEIAAMQQRHRDLVLALEFRQQNIARLTTRNHDLENVLQQAAKRSAKAPAQQDAADRLAPSVLLIRDNRLGRRSPP